MAKRKPWGHVVRITIYVEGDAPDSEAVVRAARRAAAELERVDSAGVTVEPARERPSDTQAT